VNLSTGDHEELDRILSEDYNFIGKVYQYFERGDPAWNEQILWFFANIAGTPEDRFS
jgi:hypothetical protein